MGKLITYEIFSTYEIHMPTGFVFTFFVIKNNYFGVIFPQKI